MSTDVRLSAPTLPRLRGRLSVRTAGVPLGIAGLGAVLGSVTWLVLAAAQRPSTLSPRAFRGHAPWVLGPLSGAMPGLTHDTSRLEIDLLLVLGIATAGWLVVWVAAPHLGWRLVLGVVAVAHLVLLLGPPLPLTDVFNYELYARMAALHGLNPYRALPVAAHTDPVFALSNWHHLSSPYGPLFTLLGEALTPLGAHGWLWGWKAIVGACSLGAIVIVGDLAARLGVSRARAIAVLGLSPLLLIEEVGGLHQDVPAVLCLVAAVWCLVRGREEGAPGWTAPAAGALVVAAAAIKPSFALVAPIVVLGAADRPRALAGAAGAAVLAGAATLLAFGTAMPDVSTQGTLVSPLSVPNLLGLAAGHGGADATVRAVAQTAVVAVAVAAAVVVARRRERALGAVAVVLVVTVLGLAWVMPWYLVWALPFLAVLPARRIAVPLVAATVWLAVGGTSQVPAIIHWAGYFPTHSATGRANHRTFERLVR